jgi:hypothetical protein
MVGTDLVADITGFLFFGDRLKSAIGVLIASVLLFIINRPRVRTYFMPFPDFGSDYKVSR